MSAYEVPEPAPILTRLLSGLRELRDGNFRRRLLVSDNEIAGELATVVNELAERNQRLVTELERVSDRINGGESPPYQVDMQGAMGGWSVAADTVNDLISGLVEPTVELNRVFGAVANGDLSPRMSRRAGDQMLPGRLSGINASVNRLLDQLSLFVSEITRLAREIGTEGRLGGQAQVPGLMGTWRDLADAVNRMAGNLTGQVRDISQVAQAVAAGDLSRKITVEVSGETLELKETINTMVDQLSAFAAEVTRVAHDVANEGILGGQANVPTVAGTWKDLTDNVNLMADNVTSQVRNIAEVTTAVANGDLSKKIDVNARGEMLRLKVTINTMVDQLSAFADEVTRVAREVGTEGKLGGQAEVADVSGTWQRLTENVNQLASNLTTQVRAIAAVATAVTAGDLTRQITVDASGEVAELKDDINEMISNLKETTRTNQEQDWLKTNLARISGLMQGQHNLNSLASLIMGELTPLVSAQFGIFFLVVNGTEVRGGLEQAASYGIAQSGVGGGQLRFEPGESLVGQAAVDKKTIRISGVPPDYVRVSSGLGEAVPVDLAVLPVLFEGQVLAVIELASVHEFSPVHLDLLEQLKETIGVEVNTIVANSRTEELLSESQHLAEELRARSEELEQQQNELQRSNTELEEKAALLASRNRDIEIKNIEIEQARQELEERARQLSLASAYKSEFLANMSHELRTPLNSALIMAKLLADNMDGNLTGQQVELAKTIHSAGTDLLQLINDVLDLSKVESGFMEVLPEEVDLTETAQNLESLYRPLTAEKNLDFAVTVAAEVPSVVRTDKNRMEQILRNLLANAVKFTEAGSVELRIELASVSEGGVPYVAFAVRDTGVGIAPEKLSLVFEAFQQADGTTAREYGGTGLGLSISREFSTLLGGTLEVDSEPDGGSTFTLYLPIEEETTNGTSTEEAVESEVPARQSVSDSSTTVANSFHGEKVLIVDDDRRSVLALGSLLEQRALRVVYADSGVAGLRMLQEHTDISLVVMDVMMPELDGNTTIRTIRAMPRYHTMPIIAVTANAMPGDREKSLSAGASDCVTKPVEVDRLLLLLDRYLRSAGQGPAEADEQ